MKNERRLTRFVGPKLRPPPDLSGVDPAMRRILEEVYARRLPWAVLDPGVRQWIYRIPTSADIGLVRRNLQFLGLDLYVGPLATDAE